jgi:uncharacterized protein YecA (UPF0149 family)
LLPAAPVWGMMGAVATVVDRIEQARAGYAASMNINNPGELIAWPPGRNQPCWCGSGRKYKKCCTAPGAQVR